MTGAALTTGRALSGSGAEAVSAPAAPPASPGPGISRALWSSFSQLKVGMIAADASG